MRKPTDKEINLINFLIERSSFDFGNNWSMDLLVSDMNDGEMGSLILYPNGITEGNRIFGDQISDYQFTDSDEVVVIASLNIDTNGFLFELDIWKTNFEKLINYPCIL